MTTFTAVVAARAGDDAIGLRFEDRSWTWGEVVDEAERIAAAIATLPARPDRQRHVGVLLDNVPEYVFWMCGAALAGATLVGLNASRAGAELAGDLEHADIDLVITEPRLRHLLDGVEAPAGGIRVIGDPALDEWIDAAGPWTEVPVDPGDVALLLFSSGTTGTPKAVIVSQGRLGGLAVGMTDRVRLRRDSVTYLCMPLFHGNSVMMNLAPAMNVGAQVCLARRFSASGFARDVHRFGATYANYVGRALSYVLAQPADARDAASSLELVYGTEASESDIREFADRFGCEVMEGYGLSEGVFRITRTPDTPPGALGSAQGSFDVRVLDEDTGLECPRARFDEAGRLVDPAAIGQLVAIGGASAFEGYYRNPEASAQRVRGDDFWTGDLAYRDEAGWMYFAGRSSDWIRVDGENFAAAQVERILERMPQIRSAAVFAVPDPRTGDRVMAAVEVDAELAPIEIGRFLQAQPDLGAKWWPSYLQVVEALPLTGSGKVNKNPLRVTAWTVDGVHERVGRTGEYRELDAARRDELTAEFEAHGRSALVPSR